MPLAGRLLKNGQYALSASTKAVAGARDATKVDVPEGSYPGVDPAQETFRGRAVTLKANAVRILDWIDGALDTTAGRGGVDGILSALKATTVSAEGGSTDGFRALSSAIRTVEASVAELAAIMVNQENPG